MNCYMCDIEGYATDAVAVCQHCGAALCREHLDYDLLAKRPHGLHRAGCTHALPQRAQIRREQLWRLEETVQ